MLSLYFPSISPRTPALVEIAVLRQQTIILLQKPQCLVQRVNCIRIWLATLKA
jgi:hypothetical protein